MMNKIPSSLLFLSSIPMLTSIYLMLTNNTVILEWEIMNLGSTSIMMTIMLDWTGSLYSSMVLFISANVMKFSKMYMMQDKFTKRFSQIVLMFVLSMNFLIYVPNLMSLLIGWDGLGITSFILVIYYNNSRSIIGGLLTALTNRLGDLFLLLSIVLTLDMGSWMLLEMSNMSMMQTLLIMGAAMTKSAQMPFSSWLPAAMAAPTPVSALVHSSTLVTAGIFILIRFNSFIMYNQFMLHILTITGIMTTILASVMAMYESDLKKIIALSTLSQLGFMMIAISLKLPMLAYFHMCTHAMFKALLFIAAGSLISLNNHNQDIRMFGSYSLSTPMISTALLTSNSALMGLPFLSGYYSKHQIMFWSNSMNSNMIIMVFMFVAIMLTSIYSMKLLIKSTSFPTKYTLQLTHLTTNMNTPLLSMSMTAICIGSSTMWLMSNTKDPQMSSMTFSQTMNFMLFMGLMFLLIMINNSFSNKMLWINSMFFLNYLTPYLSKSYAYLSIQLNKLNDQSWLEFSYSYKPFLSLKTMSSNIEMNIEKQPKMNLFMSWMMAMCTMMLFITYFYNSLH